MGKRLVAFFSASGITKKVAEMIASAVDADMYEIMPKQPYSKADLNWMDKKSRSSVEMSDKKFRPEISDIDVSVERYDEIILGYNFSGKKIVLFATSGGSGFGNTVSELKLSAPDAVIIEGKVFHKAEKREIAEWVRSIL